MWDIIGVHLVVAAEAVVTVVDAEVAEAVVAVVVDVEHSQDYS